MSQVILRWPPNPGRPWVRERVLATLEAGRCLLLPFNASAGPYHRAVEGDGWALIDEYGRVELYPSARELAAFVACYPVEVVRTAIAMAWRHEIAASAADQAERDAWTSRDHYRSRPSLYKSGRSA